MDMVGHSQGTVVARYYTRFLRNRVVDDLVLLASPHNGITNCTLVSGCGGVNPEDCPGSALMKKLNGVAPNGDGSNDETPGATFLGPVHYSAGCGGGGTTLELYPAPPAAGADASTRVGFAVADVASTCEVLRAAGHAIRSEPKASEWGVRAVVVDPDGRAVELLQ